MSKKNNRQHPEFNYKKCMACTMCADTCPVSCLALSINFEGVAGHRYPYLPNEAACISCGNCAVECPVDAIVMVGQQAA